jgi:hypothetical protein
MKEPPSGGFCVGPLPHPLDCRLRSFALRTWRLWPFAAFSSSRRLRRSRYDLDSVRAMRNVRTKLARTMRMLKGELGM